MKMSLCFKLFKKAAKYKIQLENISQQNRISFYRATEREKDHALV
jgi:hypothetical protein